MPMKTEPLLVAFRQDERGIVKRMAQRERCSETEYVRRAVILDAALAGDRKAWRLVGDRLLALLAERLKALRAPEAGDT